MTDLGAWPAEQATVLVEVLQRAGLQPEAKRTREGIHVVVPDAESDQAHQILVANMDAIARAARPTPPPGGRRRARPSPRGSGDRRRRGGDGDGDGRKLTSERLTGLGPALGLLLVVVILAVLVRPLTLPIIVFGVGGVIYVLGKQTQRDEDR